MGRRRKRVDPCQLVLPFFERCEPQGLADALARGLGGAVRLVITDNRSTMLSFTEHTSPPTLRAHRMFLDAPAPVVAAVASYFRRTDRRSSRLLDGFIEERSSEIRESRKGSVARRRLRHGGRFFHLGRTFEELNERYFGGAVDASITWGRRGKRGWRRAIRLGSYSEAERLIRIHPTLDRSFVPRFFLELVVHHEMLHAFLGSPVVGGRHRYHGREFQRLERRYAGYARAVAWEKQNLEKLLRIR